MPPFTKTVAEHLMFPLWVGGRHMAVTQVADTNLTYYTSSLEADPKRPFNCTVNLMQWLNEKGKPQYGTHPKGAKRKIFTTLQPDLMTYAMAEMNNIILEAFNPKDNHKAADAAAEFHTKDFESDEWEGREQLWEFAVIAGVSPQIHLTATGSDPLMRNIHRLYMMAAFTLIIQGYDTDSRDEVGNVCAILADSSGRVIGWGRNTRGINSTRHAEVNLIQGLYANHKSRYNESLKGAILYTTLKPCQMCAGMIHHAGKGEIEVVYGQNDPGDDANGTVLDKFRKNWLLGESEERPVFLPDGQSLHESLTIFREKDKITVKGQTARRMVDSLGQDGAKHLMEGAALTLERKMAKYSGNVSFAKMSTSEEIIKYDKMQRTFKYDQMQKTLNHLKFFLLSKKRL
jgi:tRNA(Arg) A34 adenosine deaminase TadA